MGQIGGGEVGIAQLELRRRDGRSERKQVIGEWTDTGKGGGKGLKAGEGKRTSFNLVMPGVTPPFARGRA